MINSYDAKVPQHEADLARLFYIANGLPEGSEIPSDENMENLTMVND